MNASASASDLKWRPTVRRRDAAERPCGAAQRTAPYPRLAPAVPHPALRDNLLYRRFPIGRPSKDRMRPSLPAPPQASRPKPRAFFSYPNSVQQRFDGFSPAPRPTQSSPVKAGPATRHPGPQTRNPKPERGSNPVKVGQGRSRSVRPSQGCPCRPAPRPQTQTPNLRLDNEKCPAARKGWQFSILGLMMA